MARYQVMAAVSSADRANRMRSVFFNSFMAKMVAVFASSGMICVLIVSTASMLNAADSNH